MAIAKIQLHDGRIAKFEVPDGTTEQQVVDFASGIDFGEKQTGVAEDTTPTQAAGISFGKGLLDFARGIMPDTEGAPERFQKSLPLFGEKTAEYLRGDDEITRQAYRELEEKHPKSTLVGEIAGQSAPFVAASGVLPSPAGLVPRMLTTGAAGAVEGGVLARGMGGDESETAQATLVGGGVGAVSELVLPRLGRVARAIYRRVKGGDPTNELITAAGTPTKELTAVLDEAGLQFDDLTEEVVVDIARSGDVDKAQAARKAFLEAQGVKPTKAQVTREATDFQVQQEAAKTSGGVRDLLEEQEAVLSRKFDTRAYPQKEGATSVANSVIDKATALDEQVSSLYKRAAEAAPTDKNIGLNKLAGSLRQYISADTKSGGNVSAIVGQLKNLGVLDDKMRVRGRISASTAEEVRKFMNTLYDQKGGFGNMVLKELKDALDEDVLSKAGADIYREARKAKSDFMKGLERAKVSKFDDRGRNLVKDIMENKIDPDDLVNKVIFKKGTWRADDLQQLKNYVQPDDWQALKADVFEEIKKRAFTGPEDANGFRALSRAKLESAIDAIGWKRINVILDKEEQGFLRDMIRVSRLREPVRGTALGKGPSAQAIGSIEERLKRLPWLGDVVKSIDYDAKGRYILKSAPREIRTAIETDLPRIGAAAGIPYLQSDNEQNYVERR